MEMSTKETLWYLKYKGYMTRYCDDKGRIKIDNMTRSERRGFFKLAKRVKANDIVISTTDKSGEITISSYASYMEQGQVHIKNDTKVSWEEVNDAKHRVLCHTKVLTSVFNTGEAHGEKNQNRCKKDLNEDISVLSNLTLLQKDHKHMDPISVLPKTCPV